MPPTVGFPPGRTAGYLPPAAAMLPIASIAGCASFAATGVHASLSGSICSASGCGPSCSGVTRIRSSTAPPSPSGCAEASAVPAPFPVAPLQEGPPPDALQIDPDNDACTPVAAKLAQPAMDAIGSIAAAAERAKAGGKYPAVLPGGNPTVGGIGLAYTPYDDGARYVVTITVPLRTSAAFINCARLSIAQPDDREKHHLFLPAPGSCLL